MFEDLNYLVVFSHHIDPILFHQVDILYILKKEYEGL